MSSSKPTPLNKQEELGAAINQGKDVEAVDFEIDSENARLLDDAQHEATGSESNQFTYNETFGRRKLFILLIVAGAFIIIAILFAIILISLSKTSSSPKYGQKYPPRTNGTHWFNSTVVVVSLDGFRSDYLDRNLTQSLTKLANRGVRAEYMKPSFPSVTFPNHYTLVTGLYPESHGIVGNHFIDPVINDEFVYSKPEKSWGSKWWGGEPIWISAVRQGLRSAVHMWPGCSTLVRNMRPTYHNDYDPRWSLSEKVDQVLEWLDLPDIQRPEFIAAYVSTIDTAGHAAGPDSDRVNAALRMVDDMLGLLMDGLDKRNLTDIVNLIVVSDHGMAATSNDRLIFYEDFAPDMLKQKEPEAWPLLGIRPDTDVELEILHTQFLNASRQPNSHFQVYLREEIPGRFHYSNSPRIAPLVAIPDPGWVFITHSKYDSLKGKPFHPMGVHGYDNENPLMRAIFIGAGPEFMPTKKDNNVTAERIVPPFQNIELYGLLAHILGIQPAPNNGTGGPIETVFVH
ncbi:uncharacterized protein VTP21DRAFT_11338 [Calcarisporiella thermophila]|uniref:uncharacterized protein n=1 Tax=Calcarisporiella thermophila TaxID=911321 RepID=UPI0037448103